MTIFHWYDKRPAGGLQWRPRNSSFWRTTHDNRICGGINLYPDVDPDGADFIEYDSMINLRRSRKNRSCGIEDEATRAEIVSIVKEWIA
jgi:hypothetical protein